MLGFRIFNPSISYIYQTQSERTYAYLAESACSSEEIRLRADDRFVNLVYIVSANNFEVRVVRRLV
jgi:hypothetical protein